MNTTFYSGFIHDTSFQTSKASPERGGFTVQPRWQILFHDTPGGESMPNGRPLAPTGAASVAPL